MALTTTTYLTAFNVSLTNPLFILSFINERKDVNRLSRLVGLEYVEDPTISATYIQYEMSMYADQSTFEGGFKGLNYITSESVMSWGFNTQEERFEGLTSEEAAYLHFKEDVMPSYSFTEATLSIGPILP